jgi:hypothetical protein
MTCPSCVSASPATLGAGSRMIEHIPGDRQLILAAFICLLDSFDLADAAGGILD